MNNKTKNSKDIDKLYENTMRKFFDEIEGMILYDKHFLEPVLIVSITPHESGIWAKTLRGEIFSKESHTNWKTFRKCYITKKEYDEKKDVLEALNKTKTKYKKLANTKSNIKQPYSKIRYK